MGLRRLTLPDTYQLLDLTQVISPLETSILSFIKINAMDKSHPFHLQILTFMIMHFSAKELYEQ